jgi:hypothetical protein
LHCDDCMAWFVQCPCCKESFCPDCGKTESAEAKRQGLKALAEAQNMTDDQLLKALSIAEEALKEISERCGPPENIAKYALEDMKGCYVGGLKGVEETANRKADPKED